MKIPTCVCGSIIFEESGFGLDFCTQCGVGKPGSIMTLNGFVRQDRLSGHQSYTRRKRFKKYLFRAMRMQSSSTVPQETWE